MNENIGKLVLFMVLTILFSCSDEYAKEEYDEQLHVQEIEKLYKELRGSQNESVTNNVMKRNPKKLYVHYMPWFHSKEYDGFWGQHWTMTNKNPDSFNEFGNREIASHYYPLIGPYASKDPDLHEYHLLLMKLSGIDGVIFDWYGSRDIHDYGALKENTESFVKEIEEVGLEFAIMYEDKVAQYAMARELNIRNKEIVGVEAVIEDIKYIENTYFKSENYIRKNGNEMLFVFGPHFLISSEDWMEVFSNIKKRPEVFTLWKASDRVGINSRGEFSWIDKEHLETLNGYYNYARENGINTVGGAYAGFNDFYSEGGWREPGERDWIIPHENGYTFSETLDLMDGESVEFIQLLTWNDFGEGTMLEPTQEFGFAYLRKLQLYSGVSYTEEELNLPYNLYMIKKKYYRNTRLNNVLDGVYRFIYELELKKAALLLKKIEEHFPV